MGVDVEMFQNKFVCTYSGQALYKIGKVAFAVALGPRYDTKIHVQIVQA